MAKEIISDHIYPEQDDYRDAAEEYLLREHSEFFGGLTRKRWLIYYEKYLHQPVSILKLNFRITI